MSGGQERTEAPSNRRKNDFRKRGEIPKSPELSFALSFAAGLYLLGWALPGVVAGVTEFWRNSFGLFSARAFEPEALLRSAGGVMASSLLPFFGAMGGLALAFGAVPSGIPSVELKFDLSRLSPAAGFSRLWRPDTAVELAKNLLKIAVLGWVLYSDLRDRLEELAGLAYLPTGPAAAAVMGALGGAARKAAAVLLAFGAADLAWKTFSLKKRMKMTKEEVKEERKSEDGNPLIKGKIRTLMRQMSRRTRLAAVAKASVVVVNPTHYAVALKYERGKMASPEVVAKGLDLMALKIIEIARANGVPVHRNVPLARALYRMGTPGQAIPPSFYKAVAEVFAWVYAQKRGWKGGRG